MNGDNDCKTLVFKVPSEVLPERYGYLINTAHTDFKKIKLIETTDLVPDKTHNYFFSGSYDIQSTSNSYGCNGFSIERGFVSTDH
jgi:hypothetical protein